MPGKWPPPGSASGHFEQLWIDGVGPALGARLAVALTFALRGPTTDREEQTAEGKA